MSKAPVKIEKKYFYFKETPRNYFFIQGKRVSEVVYRHKETMCRVFGGFDCLQLIEGSFYKTGFIVNRVTV